MSKIIINLNFNDFGSKNLMKKKIKKYLLDKELGNYKISKFPQFISLTLVMFLEDIFTNCIVYIEKNVTTGLYVMENKFLPMVFDKYDFLQKYLKKYNNKIAYDGNLIFNVDKVYKNLEYKVGEKIMVDNEAKNHLNYIMVCIQYDLINLSETILSYNNKKTFSKDVFLLSLKYLFADSEFIKKVNLKLDCYDIDCKKTDDDNSAIEDSEMLDTVDIPEIVINESDSDDEELKKEIVLDSEV